MQNMEIMSQFKRTPAGFVYRIESFKRFKQCDWKGSVGRIRVGILYWMDVTLDMVSLYYIQLQFLVVIFCFLILLAKAVPRKEAPSSASSPDPLTLHPTLSLHPTLHLHIFPLTAPSVSAAFLLCSLLPPCFELPQLTLFIFPLSASIFHGFSPLLPLPIPLSPQLPFL